MYWVPEIGAVVAALTPGWGYMLDPPWVFVWIAIAVIWKKVYD